MQSSEGKPHPATLAKLLLEHGDAEGAVSVCEAWRNREPDDRQIDDVERAARNAAHEPRPLPFSQDDCERYVQHGYLPEAREIYRRVAAAGGLDHAGRDRLAVLEEFLSFQLSVDADPDQISAEERVASGKLSTALLDYRKLAKDRLTDGEIIRRADLLRSLVLGVPAAIQAENAAPDLAETTQMPLATKALLVLKEGNLALAAQLFKVEGGRDEEAGRLADSLERLSELTTTSPLKESAEEDGTMRLSTEHFAAFHVRVSNFSEALELFVGLVEQHPDSERFRKRVADLQRVTAYLGAVDGEEELEEEPVTERQVAGTGEIPPRKKKNTQPQPERALGKRSGQYELAAFRPPDEPGGEAKVEIEERFESVEIDVEASVEETRELQEKEEQAAVAMAQADYDEALVLYRELLARDPGNEALMERVTGLQNLVGEEDEEGGDNSGKAEERPWQTAPAEQEIAPPAGIDSKGLMGALQSRQAEEDELFRSTESWMPTQRVAPVATPEGEAASRAPERPPPGLATRRKHAKTMETPPPTVADDHGSSIVEVPLGVSSAVERTPGPIDAGEAAEVAEPFGVIVRAIVIIE